MVRILRRSKRSATDPVTRTKRAAGANSASPRKPRASSLPVMSYTCLPRAVTVANAAHEVQKYETSSATIERSQRCALVPVLATPLDPTVGSLRPTVLMARYGHPWPPLACGSSLALPSPPHHAPARQPAPSMAPWSGLATANCADGSLRPSMASARVRLVAGASLAAAPCPCAPAGAIHGAVFGA